MSNNSHIAGMRETTIAKVAGAMLKILITFPQNVKDARTGGFLVIADRRWGDILRVFAVGTINPDKLDRYLFNAQEKVRRLFGHQTDGHLSSFQSRNEELQQWTGAVTMGDVLIGFSGLCEASDEALCLALGELWAPREEARQIAAISSNEDFARLALATGLDF